MRSPMSSTAAMKTTSMGTTSKARPPAGGKASDVSAVIKPTERPRARSWLKVRSRRPMEPRTSAGRSASVGRVAMVEVAAIEVAVVEVVAIDDRSAVRDVGVVVVNHNTYISHSRTIINRNNFNHGNFNRSNFNHGNASHGSSPAGGGQTCALPI